MKTSTKIGLAGLLLSIALSKKNTTPQKKKFVIDKSILDMESNESASDDVFMHSSTTTQN